MKFTSIKKTFALLSALTALPVMSFTAAHAENAATQQAPVPAATAFVTKFGGELTAILNNASVPAEQKAQAIMPLVEQNVDIAGIGKYCLGRYWRTATPAQQKHFIELFHMVILQATTAQIGNYTNVSIRVVHQVPTANGGAKVTALIMRPKQPVLTMVVVVEGSPLKLTDLYGEGVSLKLTERNDYTAFLARHNGNVQALIDTLENHINAAQQAAASQNAAAKPKTK